MNKRNNPAWVFRFLSWYSPTQLYEEIEGDLIQKFEKDVNLYGEKKQGEDYFGALFVSSDQG